MSIFGHSCRRASALRSSIVILPIVIEIRIFHAFRWLQNFKKTNHDEEYKMSKVTNLVNSILTLNDALAKSMRLSVVPILSSITWYDEFERLFALFNLWFWFRFILWWWFFLRVLSFCGFVNIPFRKPKGTLGWKGINDVPLILICFIVLNDFEKKDVFLYLPTYSLRYVVGEWFHFNGCTLSN